MKELDINLSIWTLLKAKLEENLSLKLKPETSKFFCYFCYCQPGEKFFFVYKKRISTFQV